MVNTARSERVLARVWIAVMAAACVWLLANTWVADDIFITFRYSDNVLEGHGPVYNPGERSEGYTHFLWFIVLTVGRAFQIPAHILGKYLGFPAFVGCLLLLVRLSARLFPQRGGLYGVPLAALGWATLEDARAFGSGGLETMPFIFLLLLGFTILTTSKHPRRVQLAAWAYAVATLTRPEGLLYTGLAGLWLWAQAPSRLRRPLEFAAVWVALTGPLFAFRLSYYGFLFPNPYYAKSGSIANWPQGLVYLSTFFKAYFVLLLSVVAVALLIRTARKRHRPPAAGPLTLGLVCAAANIFYVTRVGGDFMFARFYLPATPFLLLACEWVVHHLPRPPLRVAAAVVFLALIAVGIVQKHSWFDDKGHVRSIVDEPQWYPDERLDNIRMMADALRKCFEGTNAVIMVQGGQASLAYYGRFPVAVERYGLTDAYIAHTPTPPIRGRPGHEKLADAQYIYDRRVNLRFHYQQVRSLPQYVMFGLPWEKDILFGEIIVYDRPLMEQLKRCQGVRFLDFPIWLENSYIPKLDERFPRRVGIDYNNFKRVYFNHNPDPEGLLAKLEAELARLGIEPPPQPPLQPDFFGDTGRPTIPGGR
jgi:arabinofuranosyltransferase